MAAVCLLFRIAQLCRMVSSANLYHNLYGRSVSSETEYSAPNYNKTWSAIYQDIGNSYGPNTDEAHFNQDDRGF